VFDTTFSNISAISWRPVLEVEEAGVSLAAATQDSYTSISIINITPVSSSSFNNMFFQNIISFQFGNILFLHIYMNKGSKSSVKIRQKAL
jgi:hypothetical protein